MAAQYIENRARRDTMIAILMITPKIRRIAILMIMITPKIRRS